MLSNVYVIQCSVTGNVKIGQSRRVHARLRTLQACSPSPLTLIRSVAMLSDGEHMLHCACRGSRLHGEWFSPAAIAVFDANVDDVKASCDAIAGYRLRQRPPAWQSALDRQEQW